MKIAVAAVMIILSASAAQAQHSGSNVPKENPDATNKMSQPSGIAEQEKRYQPANPAPDTRSAPTSSSSGIGNDSGGRPEQKSK